MNAIVQVNGQDITDAVLLEATQINYDSSRHITTASITLVGTPPGSGAIWGEAEWGVDTWTLDMPALSLITILDGRDLETKLFEGLTFAQDLKQTDIEGLTTLYTCELNDYTSWLDRAVCWDATFPVTFPTSDSALIKALVGQFCPQITAADLVETLLPAIMSYEWQGKTCRQVLDEIATLALAEWRVNFDAELYYGSATTAPPAPYSLSTSPDFVTSFPVRVDSFKSDFTNPINRCFVRGGYIPGTAIAATAEYADPVSIEEFGEFSYSIRTRRSRTRTTVIYEHRRPYSSMPIRLSKARSRYGRTTSKSG